MKAHCCRKFTDDAVIIVNDIKELRDWDETTKTYVPNGKTKETFSLISRNNYDGVEELYDIQYCCYCGQDVREHSQEITQEEYDRIFEGRNLGGGNEDNIFLEVES